MQRQVAATLGDPDIIVNNAVYSRVRRQRHAGHLN